MVMQLFHSSYRICLLLTIILSFAIYLLLCSDITITNIATVVCIVADINTEVVSACIAIDCTYGYRDRGLKIF